MKKLPLILAILSIAACTKMHFHPNHEVTWRFVLYDSNNRVVDSTAEIHVPDSSYVTMLGPSAFNIIPYLGHEDTVVWPTAATFFLLTGPSTLLPGIANIPVPSGGCAFRSQYVFPSLDRTGWMLQRTENGQRINMFSQKINPNGYDGKYNDIPYPIVIDGISYPSIAELDYFTQYWVCGSTQGSCTAAPQFTY